MCSWWHDVRHVGESHRVHRNVQVYICLQVGNSSNGSIQIGNATIVSADIGAVNGVVHVVDKFPLLNAAFNTSMVAALEAAGDFGPFNDSKVIELASLVLLQPRAQPERSRGEGGMVLEGVSLTKRKRMSERQQHNVSVFKKSAAALYDTQLLCCVLC